MTGQNQAKLFQMIIYKQKIILWDPQANESNFEKIYLWQTSHAKGNTKISSVENSLVKELVLAIL